MPSPIAGLKLMPTGTTKNEAIFNEDLILFEALLYRGVVSQAETDPSSLSPTDGQAWLVPTGSPNVLGDWIGHDSEVAVYYGSAWRFIPAGEGLTLWIVDEAKSVQYRSGAWGDSGTDGGGGAVPPTRTTVTLSGISTSESVPAGCTHFKYTSESAVISSGTENITVEMYNTGDTVQTLFTGWTTTVTTAASSGIVANSASMGFAGVEGSVTARGLAGTVDSPRDATKTTTSSNRSYYGAVFRSRDMVADSAQDDDTIRFVGANSATLTGSVEIEWYYN